MDGLHNRFIKFAQELYRRRVPRVIVAYALAGAAAINVADILVDIFVLPDYTSRLILVLLLAGFPVAIALSWALDVTSHGIVRTPAEPDLQPHLVARTVRRRRIATAGTVIAVALLTGITIWRFAGDDGMYRPDEAVAVIPTVRGTDQDTAVASALSTLLSTRLESAGWKTVDGDQLRAQLGLPLEPAKVAGRVAAGYFVDLRLDLDDETALVRASLFAVDNPRDTLRFGEHR